MMREPPRFERYRWAGGEEWMTRWGPADGPQVVAALPLFEEANRTRAFVVTILRLLADRGIGSVLPDVPGQGESLVPTEQARLGEWRSAFAAAALLVDRAHLVAVRSGALIVADARAQSRWALSPQDGRDLTRELRRMTTTEGVIAGNRLAPELLGALEDVALPAEGRFRTVRLASDPKPADRHIDAPPLWRRAEPDNDPVLAQTLAADIADWIATCGD